MPKNQSARTGGCLCGDIRYEVTGEPSKTAICHCTMCKRWTGSPFASAAEFPADAVVWNKDPTLYPSSDAGKRSFCPKCGSSLGFHWANGTVWITLGSLDHPEQMRPQSHIFAEEELSWAHLNDGIPHHAQFGPT
jgi:hypothetical protein